MIASTVLKAIVLIFIFAATVILVEFVARGIARRRGTGRAINKRLELIERGMTREEAAVALRRERRDEFDALPSFLQGPGKRIEKLMYQAGLTSAPTQLVLMLLALPIVLFLLLMAFAYSVGIGIGMGRIVLFLAVALAFGLALPLFLLSYRAKKRRRKIEEQFPTALDIFVRGLRAGHPIAAALELLTVEMADPIGTEFGLVVDEMTYGGDLRDALAESADRWDLEDMRMFVTSLSIQQETGGNLAEILENLSKVIRDRHALFLKVRALSSEGRMTALILSVLPVGAFMLIFALSPAFFLDTSDDPIFVPAFIGLSIQWALGVWIMRKIIDIKV